MGQTHSDFEAGTIPSYERRECRRQRLYSTEQYSLAYKRDAYTLRVRNPANIVILVGVAATDAGNAMRNV